MTDSWRQHLLEMEDAIATGQAAAAVRGIAQELQGRRLLRGGSGERFHALSCGQEAP